MFKGVSMAIALYEIKHKIGATSSTGAGKESRKSRSRHGSSFHDGPKEK